MGAMIPSVIYSLRSCKMVQAAAVSGPIHVLCVQLSLQRQSSEVVKAGDSRPYKVVKLFSKQTFRTHQKYFRLARTQARY